MVYKEQLQFGMEFKIAAAKVPGLLPNPTLTPEQQENLETLQQASGSAFDQAFVAQQVAAHAKMMPVQRAFAASGGDEALTAFADRYARWVQRHHRLGSEL
jgi:putative membrane protein